MEIDDPYELCLHMARILTTAELGEQLYDLENGTESWFIFFGGTDFYLDTETAIKACRNEMAKRLNREFTHDHHGYDS
jgi:hypothetical protein